MLILLPPSEGKYTPTRGRSLDLDRLSFPELAEPRQAVLDALVTLSTGDVAKAAEVLGLGSTQAEEVGRNAGLRAAATARADAIYTGVLYDALDVATLSPEAKRRASRSLTIASALFGLVRPGDRIPAYRLSGEVSLPGLGPVAAHWRSVLDPVVRAAAGSGLVVDLRSSTYAAFWRPDAELVPRVATVRVLQQVGDQRKVVSHFNKATKGRLVRALLEDGANPGRPEELAAALDRLGWHVELHDPARTGQQLDVVVSEV